MPLNSVVDVYVEDETDFEAFEAVNLAEISITSGAVIHHGAAPEGAFSLADVAGVGAVTSLASGNKCERCWVVLEEVGANEAYDDLCNRCAEIVANIDPKEIG